MINPSRLCLRMVLYRQKWVAIDGVQVKGCGEHCPNALQAWSKYDQDDGCQAATQSTKGLRPFFAKNMWVANLR